MAEFSKRQSGTLEVRHDIAMFSPPDATGLPAMASFFSDLRKSYLSQALNNARVASSKYQIFLYP